MDGVWMRWFWKMVECFVLYLKNVAMRHNEPVAMCVRALARALSSPFCVNANGINETLFGSIQF